MKLEESELKIVLDEILKLNPKPGGSVKDNNSSFNQFIIPDFTIINNTGTLELRLNSHNAPDLRISQDFKVMMQDYKAGDKKDKKQREAVQFIKQN